MKIRGICAGCHKKKWFVRKRAYTVPKISPNLPIVSEGELCNDCARKIKKIVKHQ